MKFYFHTLLVAVLSVLMITLPTGCTVTQAKINSVVQDIATWTPVVAADADTLLADVAAFDPVDAALISTYITQIQQDSNLVTTLSNQYLANPSAAVLNRIATLISDIATNDSAAFIAVAHIKNPNSQRVAQGILITISTAATLLVTYLGTINVSVTPAAAASLQTVKPIVQKATLKAELDQAKSQGLVNNNVTFEQAFGF